MEKDSLTKLMLFVDIRLVVLLGLIFFFGIKNSQTNLQEEVLGIQDDMGTATEYTVSVCHLEDCIYIPSDSVKKDGEIDKAMVYQEVLDKVISHFEKGYGGKGLASSDKGSFVYWKEDLIPDLSNIYDEVYRSFLSGLDTNVEIELKDLPSTNGLYATQYIEIDNSKQKLYVWNDGEIKKEILLSGPKDGYEVYGVFPIVDKGLNPKAPTGDYMPYWMAFYYSGSQSSWYGLHGLIWWYDSNGKVIYESESNIGVRKSGGCIRMVEQDAKYLYENFEKGSYILIHE